MESFHLLVISLLLVACPWSTRAAKLDLNTYLEQFGYLDDSPDHAHDEGSISQAITDFQEFQGLKQTGRLDRKTIRLMKKPRCGLPDVVKPHARPQGLESGGGHPKPQAFSAPGYKWENKTITYKVLGYTRKLGGQAQLDAYANAFKKWSDVTPLKFIRVDRGDADILISYARGVHSDGPGNKFDGKGRTLAHAYFPGKAPIAGDTHFDDDEDWTLGTSEGTDLEIVAAHEFGHALGMGHSRDRRALMAPIYRYKENYGLDSDDIRGIQSLYGAKRGGNRDRVLPPRTTTTTTTTTPAPRTGKFCNLRFDAIEQVHDGKILAFRKSNVYALTEQGARGRTSIRKLFSKAPSTVDAVVYDQYKRKLFIFKGRRYWRYTGYQADEGYPKRLAQDFYHPGAAWQWKDGGIYLFRGDQYMRWTESLTRYSSGYPRNTSGYFRGFPSGVGAAFKNRDDRYYYAFKGRKFWKFNTRAQLASDSPRDIRPTWLNCNV